MNDITHTRPAPAADYDDAWCVIEQGKISIPGNEPRGYETPAPRANGYHANENDHWPFDAPASGFGHYADESMMTAAEARQGSRPEQP